MLPLLASLALVQTGPPNLSLAIEKAVPVYDRLVVGMSNGIYARGLRGCVVSDDGTTIFGASDTLDYMSADSSRRNSMEVFRRNWMAEDAPVSSNQRGWMESQSTYDKAKQIFAPLGYFSVLSAKDADNVVIQYLFKADDEPYGAAGISLISLAYGEPKPNKVLAAPKGAFMPTDAIPDLSSDAFLTANMVKDEDRYTIKDYGITSGTPPNRIAIKAGYGPFLYDSARDAIVCFTYTEQGTPSGLAIKHLKSDAVDRVMVGGGRLGVAALLPNGRILETAEPAYPDEENDGKWGLYECVPPYKEAKYLGPYALAGSSHNGKWLLISHRELRKSWLVKVP